MVLDLVAKKKLENLRKRYKKSKIKLRSSKKSGISTKKSEEIAGEQSTITVMHWLDPYIVNRILKNNFEEDDQDDQNNMENEGDFPVPEGRQKNEKDELLRDNLNDWFDNGNTSFSKGTIITPRGSKKRKEMSSKEEEQEIDFLNVATQKLKKKNLKSGWKSDQKKSRKVSKAA